MPSGSGPRASATDSDSLALETVPCPLCGERRHAPLYVQRDLALGVPGTYRVVRCARCGLAYQNPRVRVDQLALIYPPDYPAHTREPELSRTLRDLGPAVRWVLSRHPGYAHLAPTRVRLGDRVWGVVWWRRIRKAFPPWIGRGRLLDVGCASGKFLRQMGAVGWTLAGIELDPEAAAKAREVTPHIFVGDPVDAPFPERSFDLITAFHVIEHLPDPLGALRRMVSWLAPGARIIVEVPNVAGLGGQLFGKYWAGLELPRHLTHFTPETMQAMVERAGGVIVTGPAQVQTALLYPEPPPPAPGQSRMGLAAFARAPGEPRWVRAPEARAGAAPAPGRAGTTGRGGTLCDPAPGGGADMNRVGLCDRLCYDAPGHLNLR